MNEIKWEELDFKNDFVFAKVMRNESICRRVLERILKINIRKIVYIEEQKTIDIKVDARSVRLDVYVEDENNTVYNIEMQATNRDDLPKRSRYYQGMIDMNLIEKGAYYKELKKSFVIFICAFDMFGKNRSVYTFQNTCVEDKDIILKDDTLKVFLNCKGMMNDVDEELRTFLQYIDHGERSNDTLVSDIDGEVEKVKENQEWRREYMTLLMRDQENREIGREEGLERGIQAMILDNIEENIPDERILEKLQKRFELTKEQAEIYWQKYGVKDRHEI